MERPPTRSAGLSNEWVVHRKDRIRIRIRGLALTPLLPPPLLLRLPSRENSVGVLLPSPKDAHSPSLLFDPHHQQKKKKKRKKRKRKNGPSVTANPPLTPSPTLLFPLKLSTIPVFSSDRLTSTHCGARYRIVQRVNSRISDPTLQVDLT